MNKKVFALLCCVCTSFVFLSCSDDEGGKGNDAKAELVKIPLSSAETEYSQQTNRFAMNLFSSVYNSVYNSVDENDKNVALSPLSVAYVLGMLNDGADGQTKAEITRLLGFGNDTQSANEFFKKMIEYAPKVDKKQTVCIANTMYYNTVWNISIKEPYKNSLATYYSAQVNGLDFTKKQALSTINDWCNQATKGMIPKILDELNPEAVAYLLNAVYFDAKWTNPFDEKYTSKKDFHMDGGKTVKVDMMSKTEYFGYADNDVFQTVRLPYGNGGYEMLVMLPHSGKNVSDVLKGITPESIGKGLSSANVDLQLPRFTVSKTKNLSSILYTMGMPTAFSASADFSKISDTDFMVSRILHSVNIKVSEKGTKAAAVTAAGMDSSAVPLEPEVFHANHPFMYIIRETTTGTIFFIGTYTGE